MSMSRQAGIVLPGYNPLLVANAPTIGTATAGGNNCASVAFTAPSCTGGSVISTYTAYCTTTGTNRTVGASSPLVVTGLTAGESYTFRVAATNIYGPSYPSAASNSITAVLQGAQSYTSAGTYSWVAPAGVTSVSVVAVGGGGKGGNANGSRGGAGGGGGGLGYVNNYTVIPGCSYVVEVGAFGSNSFFISTCVVRGGGGTNGGTSANSAGGTFTGTGGGNGGIGNAGSPTGVAYRGGGGGGAAGYAGNGGAGGGTTSAGSAGAGGGGGGGSGQGGSGAGVGILGQGGNGAGGISGSTAATGGSGGASGQIGDCGPGGVGGLYGGAGGGGSGASGAGGAGANGAVRIVWPGATRTFPSTNVGA